MDNRRFPDSMNEILGIQSGQDRFMCANSQSIHCIPDAGLSTDLVPSCRPSPISSIPRAFQKHGYDIEILTEEAMWQRDIDAY